jgi:hypothetical protein
MDPTKGARAVVGLWFRCGALVRPELIHRRAPLCRARWTAGIRPAPSGRVGVTPAIHTFGDWRKRVSTLHDLWRRLAAFGAALGLAVTVLVVTAEPASAYGSLNMRYAVVNTTSTANCARLPNGGTLPITKRSNGCWLNDPIDGTIFLWDAGGEANKTEFRNGGALIAKFEFHPNDEKLWIYDTAEDGDTLYVLVFLQDTTGEIRGNLGPYTAPSTGAVVEYRVVDLSWNGTNDVPEGWTLTLWFCDDANCSNNEIVGQGWAVA